MEDLPSNEKYFTVEEIIRRSRELGIDLGHGDPYNTLRYYTKIGLLPHMIRRKISPTAEGAIGHYPASVLDTLRRIEEFKKQGFNNGQIKEILADQFDSNHPAMSPSAEIPTHDPSHPLHQVEQASLKLPHLPSQPLWVNITIQVVSFLLILGLILIIAALIIAGLSPLARARITRYAANFPTNLYQTIFQPKAAQEQISKSIVELNNVMEWLTPEKEQVITTKDFLFGGLGAETFTAEALEASTATLNTLEVENITITGAGEGFLAPDDILAGANVTVARNEAAGTVTISSTGGGTAGVAGEAGNALLLDSLDSSQFLRSDISDSFTSGTLTFGAGTALSVLGSFSSTGATILGATTLTGNLALSSVSGAGLGTDFANCADESLTLGWDSATGKFVCNTDSGAGGAGDNLFVNSLAATDANFINTVVGGATAGVTFSLATIPSPDEISVLISNASATDAGVVTTGAQTFAGDKIFSGALTFNGNILANDASADTITIGQNGATPDDVSIFDGQWSITSLGVASFASVTVGGDTINDFTGTGLVMSGNSLTTTLGTSIANSELDNDTIDFDKIAINPTLDETTTISAAGALSLVIGNNVTLTTTGTGAITASDLVCTNCIGPTEITDLTLGTDTAGNYVATGASGSGVSLTGGGSEGATLTAALAALTANWDQTGNFDIVLNNAGSELVMLESVGGAFTGTLDVGDLGASAIYTFLGATGNVLTSANYSGTLDSIYVNVGESPTAGDITGSFSGGLQIGSNTIGDAELVDALSYSGALTLTGAVTANDADADTFLIGQNGGTPDVVTIAGNVSLTDTQWSIAADGSASFASVTVGGDTINEFVGTGLAMSVNTLTTTLGTSISNSELDNDTINLDKVASSLTLDEETTIAAAGALNLLIGNNVTLTTTGTGAITASDLVCTNCIGPTEITDLTLGTDTAGNYIAGATANAGLTMTGTEGGTLGISLQANKGLEVDVNGLSLIDCGDTQILKYSTGTSQWGCAADATGGGGGTWDTIADPVLSSTMAHTQFSTSFDWDMGSDAALNAFSFTIVNDLATDTTTQRLLNLTLNNSVTSGTTEALLYVNNADTNTPVTSAIQVANTGGGNYTNIFDILGTGISATEFNVLDAEITLGTETAGNYVAGATANAGLTMAGTEGGTLGISLQANKGLEVNVDGLSLIDCADTQILKYSTGTSQWGCAADATGGGTGTLQTTYETGNTISVTSGEGPLAITLTSDDFSVDAVGAGADIIFEVGQGTDQGDFRIWDGTVNWLFVDESADTLALGAAAGAGITIGGSGITTTNSGALTVTETLTADGNVTFSDAAAGDTITIGDSLVATQDTVNIQGDINIGTDTDADVIVIGDTGNADTFSLNSTGLRISTTGSLTNVGTNITAAAGLTITSTTNTLTLDSGNNILTIAAGDTTLQRTAAGTYTIDLVDGSNTTLSLTNSGAGIASLSLAEAGSYTGAGAVTLSSTTNTLTLNSGNNTLTIDSSDTTLSSSLTSMTAGAAFTINGTSYVRIGDTNTPGTATGDDALYVEGALEVDGGTTFDGTVTANTDVTLTLAGTEDLAITHDGTGGVVNVLNLAITPSATAGVMNGITVTQADSANTNPLDAGMLINNLDTNLAIPAAISITNTGGGGYTNYLDTPTIDITGTGSLTSVGTNITAAGALTIASTTTALTLDSGSNTLVIAATDTTLQRTAAGTYTIDLVDGSATTLSITNSGAGIASVSLAEAGSYTGAGAVTLSSTTNALTLDSGSNTLVIAANDTTLQRTAAGTYTIDLADASATTLSLTNSLAGITSLSLAEAGSYTGAGAVTLSSTTSTLTLNSGNNTLTIDSSDTSLSSSLTSMTAGAGFTINGTSYVRIGDTNTPGTATGDDALYVEGALEVDGAITFDGALTENSTATFNSDVTLTFTGTENLDITHDLAGTINVVNLVGTPNASANTAYGVYIDQADSANANGFDASLVIDNSDVTGAAIAAGILFVNAGSGFTNYIDTPTIDITGTGSLTGVGTNITASSNLTIASTTNALTLDSGSNILVIAANDTTLQRTAAGTFAIDLADGSATTLSITNSGAGIASVSLAEAGSYTGAGAVTVSSTTSALTLDSGSNTLVIAAGDTTLQRTAAGTYTIDLADAANTTLSLANSLAGIASLSLAEAGSYTGAGAVTLSSTTNTLTLNSGNNTLTLDSSDTTLSSSLTSMTAGAGFTINGTSYVRVGDTATPGVATGDDALYVEGALEVDGATTFDGTVTANTDVTLTLAGTEDLAITHDGTGGTVNVLNLAITPSATAGVMNGITITQVDSANAQPLDAAVYINNADTNLAIPAAIQVANTGGGNYTNIFDILGTGISATEFNVLDAEITLGTETAGNYIDNVTGGNGITVTGSAGEGWEPDLVIDLDNVGADGATTSSVSGLEFDTGQLTLLRGCAAGGILEWNNTSFEWACGVDDTGGGGGTLQQAYVAGNTIDVTSGELPLAITLTSDDFSVDAIGLGADMIFEIGQGTDQGDFRIWDGTTDWFFIDESADTLALGAAAGAGISIGGTGITTTNSGALTVSETLTANANVTFSDAAAGDTITIGDSLVATQDTVNIQGDINIGTDTDADVIVIGDTGNADTFSLNSTGLRIGTTGSLTNVGANITAAGALTITSTTNTLTLDSGNNILTIAAGDTTLQRTAAGTYTIDLADASATTLSITNSGAGIASMSLAEAGSYTGAGAVTLSSTTSTLTLNSGNNTLTLDASDTAISSSLTSMTVGAGFTINGTSYVRIGDTATPGTATGDDALYVEGALEVDGGITFDGALTENSTATFNSDVTMTFLGTENLDITHDLAGTINVVNILGTPNAGANTAYGVVIDQADSANANGYDASLVIDNSDVTGAAIAAGILFVNAGSGFTNYLDTPTIDITGTGSLTNVGTNITAAGALTITSTTTALTLDSGSNILVIAAGDTTLQRTAAGTYTIDLVDGSATTLSLTNSGAGIASMSLAEAGSYTGAGAVTVSSTTSALTLDSGSNTLVIAAGDTTLQRTAAGTYTIDLADAANTTLSLTNSLAGIASLSLAEAGSYTGAGAVTLSSTTSTLTLNSGNNTLTLDASDTAISSSLTSMTVGAGFTINGTSYVRIGDTATPGTATGDDALYVEGALEVDGGTTLDGSLTTNGTVTANTDVTLTLAGTEDLAITHDGTGGTVNVLNLAITPSATAGVMNGITVSQVDSANTNPLDAGVLINNLDTNLPIPAAIQVANTGGGNYTNIFDILGTGISATEFNVLDAEITLGTETAGNYIDNVTGGNGITVTGSAGEGWEPDLTVDLLDTVDGTSGITSSNSGLEFQGASSDELTLLQGCDATNNILKWNEASSIWACQPDATGGGGGTWDTIGDPVLASTMDHLEYSTSFDWNLATDAALNAFSFTIVNDLATDTTTQRLLSLTLNDSATSGTTEALAYINNADTNTAVTSAIQIANTGGGGYTNYLDTPTIDITGTGSLTSVGTNITAASGLTIASTTNTLTLDSGNAILTIAAGDTTLQRIAAGTYTIDLVDGANTTLAITNSGAGVANITADGSLTAAGVSAGTGTLQGTGGLTITGTVSINDSAAANTTSIGGGTTTGAVSIGTGASNQTLSFGTGGGVKGVSLGSNNTTSTTTILSGTTSGALALNASAGGALTNIGTGTTTGAIAIGGNANTVTIDGTNFDVSVAGTVTIPTAQSYTGAGTVTLSSATASALTINSGTTGTLAIGDDASDEIINIGTGGAIKTLTIGSTTTTSTTNIDSGSGGILLNDAVNNPVGIGTGTSTGAVTIGGTGTQTIAIGNGAGIKTVQLGSNTTTSTTTILSGTTSGALALNATAGGALTNIGTGTTTGAVTIGGTGTQTIAIGDGAGVKTVNLGSNNTTATTTILSGTTSGALSLNATAGGALTNIGTGTTTGQVTIGGTGTQTLAIGNGAGIKTVQLGSNTTTSTTTILSGTTSGALALNASAGGALTNIGTGTSTGAIAIGGNANTVTIDGTNFDVSVAGTVTIPTGQSYTGAGTVTLSSAAVSALTIDSGTTGAMTIGTSANAKSITVGNATTTTALAFNAGGSGTGFTFTLATGTSDFTVSGLDADSQVVFSGLSSCDTIDSTAGGALVCGVDAGAGASPFGAAGGLITKTTGTDRLQLTMAEAGDYGLLIDVSTAPTVDLLQITNSGFATITDLADGLAITFITGVPGAAINNAAINIAVTSGSTVASSTLQGLNIGTLTTPQADTTESAIRIGNGWDNEIQFLDTTPTIMMADASQLSFYDSSGNNLFAGFKEYFSSANYGVFEANGFINIDGGFYLDNFSTGQTTAAADLGIGSAARLGDHKNWVFDEANTGGGSTATNSTKYGCLIEQNGGANAGTSTANGMLQISPDTSTHTSTAADPACVVHLGIGTGTNTSGILNAAQKYIQYFKVKPSANFTNTPSARQMFVGAHNYTEAWGQNWISVAATHGFIGFANLISTTTATNAAAGTQWNGFARVGNGISSVICGAAGNISTVTNAFALMRIEARATNDVRFFVDGDVSNGISLTECGAGISANISTRNLNPAINAVQQELLSTAGNQWTMYVDLYAHVVDDPRPDAGALSGGGGEEPQYVTPRPDPISGADMAEYYQFDHGFDVINVGDIVVLGDKPGRAKVAARGYDRKLLGVISESPGLLLGVNQGENMAPVALVGRVRTRVSNLGGPIRIGDPITSSETLGVGMRATKPGKIIGTAMEAFDSEEGVIMVNVNMGYYLGDEGDTALLEQPEEIFLGTSDAAITAGQEGLATNQEGTETATAEIQSPSLVELIIQKIINFKNGIRVDKFFESLGNAIFRGPAEFLSNVIFRGKVQFAGKVEFDQDTAGYATIKKGARFVDVVFTNEFEQDPVVNASPIIPRVTAEVFSQKVAEGTCQASDTLDICQDRLADQILSTGSRYAIAGKSTQGFMIILEKPAGMDLTFSWTALVVKDAKTSVGDQQVPTDSPQTPAPEANPAQTTKETTLPALPPEEGITP